MSELLKISFNREVSESAVFLTEECNFLPKLVEATCIPSSAVEAPIDFCMKLADTSKGRLCVERVISSCGEFCVN